MLFNATEREREEWQMDSPTHPVGVRGCQFGFSESRGFSNIVLERSEPGYILEYMCNLKGTDLFL